MSKKNKFDLTINNWFLFEPFERNEKGEFNQFQSIKRSFLSEADAALIFFAHFLSLRKE